MAKRHFEEVYSGYDKLPITVQCNKFILTGAVILGKFITDEQRKMLLAEVEANPKHNDLSRYAYMAAILAEHDYSNEALIIIGKAQDALAAIMRRKGY